MRKFLIFGIVLLLGVIGYASWEAFLKGEFFRLSYSREVKSIMVRARQVVEKNRPPHVDGGDLKASAQELRGRYNALIESSADGDKRRPSFRKADEVVIQIEHAAQAADDPDVVESRFVRAMEWIEQVNALIGTPQDSPL